MKDFLGNDLNIGDRVIFIQKWGNYGCLSQGVVAEIKSGVAYMKVKDCDGHEYVHYHGSRSKSIFKVGGNII